MDSSERVPVVVAGANGRMGRQTMATLQQQVDLELVAGLGRVRGVGDDLGTLAGGEPCGLTLTDDLEQALEPARGGVLVDFSLGGSVKNTVLAALERQIACVIGATAIPGPDEQAIVEAAEAAKVPVLFAPNFALGAVLMMKFSAMAAKYFRWAEIIEYHHEKKLDAPSGTARRTADLMRRARQDGFRVAAESEESLKGSRGATLSGLRVHSVRMPGCLAHQEVIFGAPGETLKIRHDAGNRESYMPGVLLAVRKVKELSGAVFGLESILDA